MRATRGLTRTLEVLALGGLVAWSETLLGCAAVTAMAVDTAVTASTLASTRADVRIADSLEEVEGCRYLRFVRASSAHRGVLLQDMAREKTIAELTEMTQKLGGNVLLLKRSSKGLEGARAEGSAYLCPSPTEASGVAEAASGPAASGTVDGSEAAPATSP